MAHHTYIICLILLHVDLIGAMNYNEDNVKPPNQEFMHFNNLSGPTAPILNWSMSQQPNDGFYINN